MAGLLAGALAGAGQAIQSNAQDSIQQKREMALEKLRFKRESSLADTQWEREKTAAASAAQIEERRRTQDRQWELSDTKTEHQRAIELQKVRNQRGYGSSGPTAKQREARWLVEQGIAPDLKSAWPMVSSRADQGGESIEYVENRIEDLESVLNDQDALMSLGGSEADLDRQVTEMRDELEFYRGKRDELAASRYNIQSPGLLSRGQNSGDGSGGVGSGQPAPSSRQGAGGAPTVDDILNSVLR